MDPYIISILLGLFTNGLYSLILSTCDKVGDLTFRKEDINELLVKKEANFTLLIEGAFQDLPPIIKPEEYYEFLKSRKLLEIVNRIYSFSLSDYENLDNLEKVKADFCEQLVFYFNQREKIPTIAPKLFFILVECCLESLDLIINEEQDLLAFDSKIKFYFKISLHRLDKYQNKMLEEIKINRMLNRQYHKETEKSLNKIISLLRKIESKEKSQESETQMCEFFIPDSNLTMSNTVISSSEIISSSCDKCQYSDNQDISSSLDANLWTIKNFGSKGNLEASKG